MNKDLIRAVSLKSVLIYPPTVRLDSAKLTQFYSTVCAYKPYSQFAFLPDGARMMNDQSTQLRLAQDRLTFQERIPSEQSSFGTVRNFERIIQDFWKAFTPGVFVTQEVVLEAVWPIDETTATDYIESRFLRVGREEAQSLGAACAGVGLKLVFPQFAPAKAVELRVEPFFRDPKFLFLAVSSQDMQPVQDPAAIGERVRWVESLLGHEVADFVDRPAY